MNEIPPPLRVWSGNTKNQCLSEEIPVYWEANDVVTFLADLGMYDPSLYNLLDNNEKEREQKFKTDYFKRRFTFSRSLLKLILQPILGADQPSDILLGKEQKGRVIIPRRPDICISLSYSGQYVAISVGKMKIGCDIEIVRPVKTNKIRSCQFFINYNKANDREYLWMIIHAWTLVESCAKLFDTNSYSLLNSCPLFKDVNVVSYCVNKHLILSIASKKREFADALVWLDMYGSKVHHISPKTV
jgi:phosphopantetheinyl transferase